jgi:hypothetical protein
MSHELLTESGERGDCSEREPNLNWSNPNVPKKESPMTGNKKKLAVWVTRLAGGSRAIVPSRNRLGLWAIGLGAVLAVALLSVPSGFADGNIQCDLSTLQGQYLVSANGFQGGLPTAAAGYSIYNGNGTGEDHVTFTVGGSVVVPQLTIPFTYTLNPDCTGTRSVNPSGTPPGPVFDIFVASDGSALTEIAIAPPGFSVSSFTKRVGGQQ